MSREIEIEMGKLNRQPVGFEREIARLQHHLLRLRARYEEIACQLLQQPASEPQQAALQEVQAALLKRYRDTLDDSQLCQELLAKTRKSLAWWKQQATRADERA